MHAHLSPAELLYVQMLARRVSAGDQAASTMLEAMHDAYLPRVTAISLQLLSLCCLRRRWQSA